MSCSKRCRKQKEENIKFTKRVNNSVIKKGKQRSIKCKFSLRVFLEDLKNLSKLKLQTLLNDLNLNQSNIDLISFMLKLDNKDEKTKNTKDCFSFKPLVLVSNLFHLPELTFLKTINGLKVDSLFVKLLHKHYDIASLAKILAVKENSVKEENCGGRVSEGNSVQENGNDRNVCNASEFLENDFVVEMRKTEDIYKNDSNDKVERNISSLERNSSILEADLLIKKYTAENLDSDLLVKDTSKNLDSDMLVKDIAGDLDSDVLVKDTSENLDSDLLVKEIPGNLDSDILVKDNSENRDSDLLVKETDGNLDSDFLVFGTGCNVTQELTPLPREESIESSTDAVVCPINDNVFDIQGGINFPSDGFSTLNSSKNEMVESFSTKDFPVNNFLNANVETNFSEDKNSLIYKLNYSIYQKLKSLNLKQVQTHTNRTKEKEQEGKSLNFKTDCNNDFIMVKKKSCIEVNLNYLIQIKNWVSTKRLAKTFVKYFVCMSENHLCRMLQNPKFQDIICSQVFRFGKFEPECDDDDGISGVKRILQGGYLLLFHHSVIMDEYFVLLVLNLLKRNKSTASELSKSICFVPSSTYHSWVEKLRMETCRSFTFKGNVNFFSKELEKKDTMFLLESDAIESQCSVNRLQIVLRNLHKRFEFHHQKAIMLIGSNVNEIEFSETFYKVQNIETFLINF